MADDTPSNKKDSEGFKNRWFGHGPGQLSRFQFLLLWVCIILAIVVVCAVTKTVCSREAGSNRTSTDSGRKASGTEAGTIDEPSAKQSSSKQDPLCWPYLGLGLLPIFAITAVFLRSTLGHSAQATR